MENIVDYAREEMRTFEVENLNRVDSLVLSGAAYFKLNEELSSLSCLGELSVRDLLRAELFPQMLKGLYDFEESKELLIALSASPRFRNLKVVDYVEILNKEEEKQFSAVSFFHDSAENPFVYVAFRGTDSTFVGWKEDFNMAFQCPVPAQEEAYEYLSSIRKKFKGKKLYVGGHSKGGNLAVYSSAKLSETHGKDAVDMVFSHDGPGFLDEFLKSEAFKNISHKIDKTVPQSSIIGMIMESQENYSVIKSSGFSFWQHDYFKWYVENGDFVEAKGLSKGAELFDKGISGWLKNYSYEEREKFIDEMYDVFDKAGANTTKEFKENIRETLPKSLKAVKEMPEESRHMIFQTIGTVIKSGIVSIFKEE